MGCAWDNERTRGYDTEQEKKLFIMPISELAAKIRILDRRFRSLNMHERVLTSKERWYVDEILKTLEELS